VSSVFTPDLGAAFQPGEGNGVMSRSGVALEMHREEDVRPVGCKLSPKGHATVTVLTAPLIILAPMRSYSTVVSAMLGQHPQMYSLLETHLFTCDTMRQWWSCYRNNHKLMGHGLLRAIAELIMGCQSEVTIELARRWIVRRLAWRTADVFRVLARRVDPLVLIDKSPLIVNRAEHLDRALTEFPKARFLHLTRHPLGFGRSFLKFFEDLGTSAAADPQVVWHRQHSNILNFLATVPQCQQLRMRGEDLLAAPDCHLAEIADWIGVRTTPDAINKMKHPEESPFACFGPANALWGGGDSYFFRDPKLHSSKVKVSSLEGPLPWRRDGGEFSTEVRELAQQLGYG
jgi:hypothetical protein